MVSMCSESGYYHDGTEEDFKCSPCPLNNYCEGGYLESHNECPPHSEAEFATKLEECYCSPGYERDESAVGDPKVSGASQINATNE